MLTTIQRWGNSLAVRIPKPFAVQIHLTDKTKVEITLEGNRIVLTPLRKKWKLGDLLAGITRRNVHKESSWGSRKGREVW